MVDEGLDSVSFFEIKRGDLAICLKYNMKYSPQMLEFKHRSVWSLHHFCISKQ